MVVTAPLVVSILGYGIALYALGRIHGTRIGRDAEAADRRARLVPPARFLARMVNDGADPDDERAARRGQRPTTEREDGMRPFVSPSEIAYHDPTTNRPRGI